MRPDPGLTAKNYTPSDLAWCLAMVQPTGRMAFANRAAASGEALGVAVDMTWHIGRDGSSAYRPGADARAASLAMVGLYTAHYGNALARILALKDVAISDGEELKVQEALRLLYKSVINQIQATELNLDAWAKDDTAAALIKKTDTAIDKAAVENAITQILDIFEARAAGINLCRDETVAVPSAENTIVTCVIQ